MESLINVWDLKWFLYLLGFIFLPRISLLFVLYFHGRLFWDYASVLYVFGWFFMPRMLTGLLVAFLTQNHTLGAILAIVGFFMDGGTKYGFWKYRRKKAC